MLLLIIIIVAVVGIFIASKASGENYFQSIGQSVTNLFGGSNNSASSQAQGVPLQITQDTKTIITLKNATSITIKSNQEIAMSKDNSRVNLMFSKKSTDEQSNQIFWYVAEITNLGLGDTPVIFSVKSNSGQEQQLQVVVTRQGFNLPFGLSTVQDWPNSKYTADGDSMTAMVNKQYKLPMDYAPKELVDIHKDLLLYTNSTSPFLIRADAGDALRVMANDLHKQTGKNLVITSAYRDYNNQYSTYVNWVKDLGQVQADAISARPGFSEHQLGTAIDFVDQQTGLDLTNNFDNGVAGKWLQANSYKYGFVQSYPAGKETVTGYQHEAWHYRYIGIDNATKVKESGLTLKEWLEKNQ